MARKTTKTKMGTIKISGPAKARYLTNFVTGAPDCFAVSNKLYSCVRGLESRLINRLSGKSAPA